MGIGMKERIGSDGGREGRRSEGERDEEGKKVARERARETRRLHSTPAICSS